MAIWSLTEERVEKLMKQIGDKEVEIDTLSKTTPKQLWTTDLDNFIAEWRFQLEDEAQRAKKVAGLGRRASSKLRIAGKPGGKKRKADSDYESDDDYLAAAAKRSTTSKNAPTKAQPKTKVLINSIEQKPVARPPAKEMGLLKSTLLAGESALVGSEDEAKPVKKVINKASSTKSSIKPLTKDKEMADLTDAEEEYDFQLDGVKVPKASLIKEGPRDVVLSPPRAGRAASRKITKYVESDSSMADDLGDDLLGDVSKLVKGIGGSGSSVTTAGASKLFSANTSRQSISMPTPVRKPSKAVHSDDEDETNYSKLIPQGSPEKPAARSARDIILSDDDDNDSFDIGPSKPVAKPKPAVAKAATTKSKPVPKKATATSQPKKQVTLSPVARAYAVKQAKSGTAPAKSTSKSKAKRFVVNDDEEEEEDDVDMLADKILLSEDESEVVARKPKSKAAAAAPTGRPARRAATKAKSKYVIEEDDDDEMASEVSEAEAYDDEDDESF